MTPLHRFINVFFLAWLAIALSACALFHTPPETNTERLAAAEIAYQEILSTAIVWRQEGRLSSSDIRKFNDAFDAYETARNAARAALLIGDDVKAAAAVGKTSSALAALRTLAREYEP